jgi:hypothetical protein
MPLGMQNTGSLMASNPNRKRAKKSNDAHRVLWATFDVGSVKIRAFLVDAEKFPEMANEDGTGTVLGVCVADASLILIDWDIAPDLAELTLVHELAHADEYLTGHDHDHDVLNAVSACLYGTLKRNGLLKLPPRPPIHGRPQ